MYRWIVDSAVDRTISSQVPLSQLFRSLQAHQSIYQPVKMLHIRKYIKNTDNVKKDLKSFEALLSLFPTILKHFTYLYTLQPIRYRQCRQLELKTDINK